jgi:hypothetical protein
VGEATAGHEKRWQRARLSVGLVGDVRRRGPASSGSETGSTEDVRESTTWFRAILRLQAAVIMSEFDGLAYPTKTRSILMQALVKVLAPIGRLFGYKAC